MTQIEPFAFVLMPFSKEFEDIYKLGIKSECNDLGIAAERVDEQQFDETILHRVYRQIENCDLIVAEMTGRNPNVFYEVGYAHAKGKSCALITQSAGDIPFDLKHHPHVIYDGSISDLREKLRPKLLWMKSENEKRKIKTISVAAEVRYPDLKKTEHSHHGSMSLKLELTNTSAKRSPEIEAIYVTTGRDWKVSHAGKECHHTLSSDKKTKRHLIPSTISRISPGAFSVEEAFF